MLHGLCFGEEAGARNRVCFHVKWLQPAMKGTSSVRRLRLGSFRTRLVPSMCFATGCRLSQADAAWVRNVIVDSENFLPDLLREVP